MKHVAAYLLAQMGGNASPSAADITGILDSVGASPDDEKLAKLLGSLDGKDVVEVLALGRSKMSVLGAAAPAAAGGAAPAAAAKKEPEPEPEEEEEDMGFDLFD